MKTLKHIFMAIASCVLFIGLVYMVADSFEFNTQYSLYKSELAFIDAEQEENIPTSSNNNENLGGIKDTPISKKMKRNIKQIEMIQQFNPTIDHNDKIDTEVTPESANRTLLDNRPKMVLIIDDVSFPSQVSMIKKIDLPITPSFLPPTSRHSYSPRLAQSFDDYMIHLPLEAISNHTIEENTLDTHASIHQIMDTVMRVKQLFPKAKYINNHTGSKFTANTHAMNKLFLALDKHNFKFLDSRTTPQTKSLQVANYKVLQRNVFLDNVDDRGYIAKQLKKALKIAQKVGFAIVIGHPRKNTLQVIKDYTSLIKEQVEVITINEV